MKIYKRYLPLSQKEECAARAIVQSAFEVHKRLGPGLLESIYETCFCHELAKRGVQFNKQKLVPLKYDQIIFDSALRLDVIVEEVVICELKALDRCFASSSCSSIELLEVDKLKAWISYKF